MSCCIVWVRLGYKTLEELLQSMKDTVHCTYVNGQLMVSAVLREESVHISELVAGQKYVPKKNNKKNHQQYNKIPFALVNNNNNRQLGNGLLPVPSLGNLVATQYQSSFKGNSHSYNVNRLPQRPMMPNRESNSQAWVNQPQQQTIQDQIPVAHAQGPHMTQHSQSLEQNIHKQTSEGISHVSQQLNSESSNHSNRPPSALGEPQSTEEPVAQSTSSRPKPGVDIARLRRLMAKKLVVSQATCTEPNYQRDEQTQTTETLQTLSRLERSPTTDKHVQCPEPELAPRFDLHSRASTEHSVSLPPLSYSASPSVSVTSQLTSFSRMGDTTFVRVVPPVLPSLNKSQSSINTPVNNVPTFFK